MDIFLQGQLKTPETACQMLPPLIDDMLFPLSNVRCTWGLLQPLLGKNHSSSSCKNQGSRACLTAFPSFQEGRKAHMRILVTATEAKLLRQLWQKPRQLCTPHCLPKLEMQRDRGYKSQGSSVCLAAFPSREAGSPDS